MTLAVQISASAPSIPLIIKGAERSWKIPGLIWKNNRHRNKRKNFEGVFCLKILSNFENRQKSLAASVLKPCWEESQGKQWTELSWRRHRGNCSFLGLPFTPLDTLKGCLESSVLIRKSTTRRTTLFLRNFLFLFSLFREQPTSALLSKIWAWPTMEDA